ncbi:hypothetical protein [Phormidesmis sp. 146-33]
MDVRIGCLIESIALVSIKRNLEESDRSPLMLQRVNPNLIGKHQGNEVDD